MRKTALLSGSRSGGLTGLHGTSLAWEFIDDGDGG
jgi:hypothetical protein